MYCIGDSWRVTAAHLLLVGFLVIISAKGQAVASSMTGRAKHEISMLGEGLALFKEEIGRYPTSAEGLMVLGEPTESVPRKNEYIYRYPRTHPPGRFDLYSLGPDGKSLSEGNDPDDISNWSLALQKEPKQGNRTTVATVIVGVVALVVILDRRLVSWLRRVRAGGGRE